MPWAYGFQRFGLGINFDLKGLMTVVKQLFIFLRLSSDKGGARCALFTFHLESVAFVAQVGKLSPLDHKMVKQKSQHDVMTHQ